MWTATMIAGGLATALAGVTIQPLAITGPLVALVGLASVARSRLRAGHASPEAMSPPTRLRAESG